MWWRVAAVDDFETRDGKERGRYSRIHTRIEGRTITIFRKGDGSGSLSAIDSVCAHAGGDLTAGVIQDIEELGGLSVVLCPLHRYMYAISPADRAGEKVYQALEFKDGKPSPEGSKWTATKRGTSCQRSHLVRESEGQIYLKVNEEDEFASDRQASSDICANQFTFTGEPPRPAPDFEQ